VISLGDGGGGHGKGYGKGYGRGKGYGDGKGYSAHGKGHGDGKDHGKGGWDLHLKGEYSQFKGHGDGKGDGKGHGGGKWSSAHGKGHGPLPSAHGKGHSGGKQGKRWVDESWQSSILYNSKICVHFISTGCDRGPKCKFAHSLDKLQERWYGHVRKLHCMTTMTTQIYMYTVLNIKIYIICISIYDLDQYTYTYLHITYIYIYIYISIHICKSCGRESREGKFTSEHYDAKVVPYIYFCTAS
jgi:hypothetical protein